VEVETATASPFASSLLFDYVATYMYEGDAPNAERRAAALSLDRDLLRELLGQEELRELLDRGALEQLEAQLQRRGELQRATNRDELHDTLRLLGDLSATEASERVLDGIDAGELLVALERERRAVRVRIGGEERYIDAADAGLYRDALGTAPPGGLPDAFLADVPDALGRLLRRYAAARGPFTSEQPRARYGLGAAVVESGLRELERSGALVRGELHPDPASLRHGASLVAVGDSPFLPVPGSPSSSTPSPADDWREWCDVEVLRRLRRASLAALRHEIEPAERRAFAAFLPAWQGVDRHAASGAGVERLREALLPLQGLALTPRTWEQEVLPRRVGAYSTTWMDELCAGGELVWVGAGSLGRSDGRVALYFREDVGLLGPPPRRGSLPQESDGHARVRARLMKGPCFFADLLADVELAAAELAEALWDLVWAGEVTNDAFAPLRSPHPAPKAAVATPARLIPLPGGGEKTASGWAGARSAMPRRRGRFAGRGSVARGGGRVGHPPGRWSLTAPLFGEVDLTQRLRAQAELLLERYGILTRELVRAEGVPGGFAALYPELCRLETLGVARRGYFVEGMGGAQFALAGAVERLRAQREDGAHPACLVLAAADPAQPYGAALPWPGQRDAALGERQTRQTARPSPARVPGASVVLVDAEPALYLERGGRALRVLDGGPQEVRVERALAALAEHARAGRLPARIALERVDGEPVLGSCWEAALERAGFRVGPRRAELAVR
jgi:ATP-dependent Lhr-like helicase